MGPCSWCLVWDDPRPGHAMKCLSALEKVLSFPPDSGFSQMGLSVLTWGFSRFKGVNTSLLAFFQAE